MPVSKDKDCFSPKILTESKEKASFTTHPKSGKRRRNNKSIYEDSIAKSHLLSIDSELDLKGLFEGNMANTSFRCPLNLRQAFKTETKQNGSSTCAILRVFMFDYVLASRIKKHALGNTMSHLVDANFTIENLNFEQYTQSRPRRLIRNVESEILTAGGLLTCEIGNGKCLNEAVGKGVYLRTGKEYRLCKVHLESFSDNPRDWKVS